MRNKPTFKFFLASKAGIQMKSKIKPKGQSKFYFTMVNDYKKKGLEISIFVNEILLK